MGFLSSRPSRVAVPEAIITTSAAAITVRPWPSITVTGKSVPARAASICARRAALAAGITNRRSG